MFKKKTEELINIIKETIRDEFELFYMNYDNRLNRTSKEFSLLRNDETRISNLENTIKIQSQIIEDLAGLHGKFENCEFFAMKYYRDKHPIVYHNGELVSKDNMKKCWIMWDNESPVEIEVDT